MRTRAHPPVWMMVKEAVGAMGGSTSRRDIVRWVQQRCPGSKLNTVPDTSECKAVVKACFNAVQDWDAGYFKDSESEVKL